MNKIIDVAALVRLVALALPFIALSGCAIPLKSEGPRQIDERRQFVKNYIVGQQMTVNVGDPIIKFQDFWTETIESPVAMPNKTVSLTGGLINITLEIGRKYPVRGRLSLEGVDYLVVATTDNPLTHAVLVKPDGTLHDRIVSANPQLGGVIVVVYTFIISDPSVRVVRETTKNIQSTKGYENFEILYTGSNSSGLNLTYREFSPDGLAKVAFYQNLTYDAGAKNITFKKYRIAIDRASSESISYTVLTDGH